MKRRIYSVWTALLTGLIVLTGCSAGQENIAGEVGADPESGYVKTFKDLGLGSLLNYKFKWNKADESWVTVWVEEYINGENKAKRVSELSFGLSPDESREGDIQFGIVELPGKMEGPRVILSGMGASVSGEPLAKTKHTASASVMDYSIDKEMNSLDYGKTAVLGYYLETDKGTGSTSDSLDSDGLKQMLDGSSRLLVLKMKIEEKEPAKEK